MINKNYVLFCRIPLIINGDGRIFCESLWAKDLKLHLTYLKNFGVCCPVERRDDTEGLKDITDIGIKWLFQLRKDYGLKSVLLNFFPNLLVAIQACRKAKVVHSGGAGWAFPMSFYLLMLKPFFSFQWVIVIESSFWMLELGERRTFRKVIEHYVHKVLLTQCVRLADARIFTQSFYKDYFLAGRHDRVLIKPATWIDEEIIKTPILVKARLKARDDGVLRIIFPSRLTENKGVYTVLDAIGKIQSTSQKLHMAIIGSGDLESICRRFVDSYSGPVDVIFVDQIDYGVQFFDLLSGYDFVLVPTLKQEQPRIIFDAFSQGVPVIGSDTSGVLDITNDRNSIIFKRGDAASLADAICSIDGRCVVKLEMGLAALDYASGKTHLHMHSDRAEFLSGVL